MLSKLFDWEDIEGEPLVVGPTRVTPVARAAVVRWPGGGLRWTRPKWLHVETDGREYSVPIINVTRRAKWGAIGLGMLFAILIRVLASLIRSDT